MQGWRWRRKNSLIVRWLISGLSIFQHALQLLSGRARPPSAFFFCHCCRVLVRLSRALSFLSPQQFDNRRSRAPSQHLYKSEDEEWMLIMFGSVRFSRER